MAVAARAAPGCSQLFNVTWMHISKWFPKSSPDENPFAAGEVVRFYPDGYFSMFKGGVLSNGDRVEFSLSEGSPIFQFHGRWVVTKEGMRVVYVASSRWPADERLNNEELYSHEHVATASCVGHSLRFEGRKYSDWHSPTVENYGSVVSSGAALWKEMPEVRARIDAQLKH